MRWNVKRKSITNAFAVKNPSQSSSSVLILFTAFQCKIILSRRNVLPHIKLKLLQVVNCNLGNKHLRLF